MRSFREIEALAAERKGGADALQALLSTPLPSREIAKIPDDRWLSAMTKCIFQAGFNWQVIERKWDRFEEVFENFDVPRWSMMSDEDLDRLLKTKGIIANAAKIRAVGANARFLSELSHRYGSAGAHFSDWKREQYCANLRALQKNGARLGGRTGQIFLRRMGVDALIFSPDVLKALSREGVVARMPSSEKDFAAVQSAIDTWAEETGRPLTQISQILALSVG
ncbi:MAG: 3-methyladenine DNA glycosylase [Alphaproteobacteria bacterium]|nr:MAG: 3-methyladenine DNA glycosylase [Alphaproteobacteria bacterium]